MLKRLYPDLQYIVVEFLKDDPTPVVEEFKMVIEHIKFDLMIEELEDFIDDNLEYFFGWEYEDFLDYLDN